MAVRLLGATVFTTQDEVDSLDIFIGQSSSSFGVYINPGKDSEHSTTGCSTPCVYLLDTKTWDSVNNKFSKSFQRLPVQPTLDTTGEKSFRSIHFFQMLWTKHQPTIRKGWSYDSRFTSSTTLGSLTFHLPTTELNGQETFRMFSSLLTYAEG